MRSNIAKKIYSVIVTRVLPPILVVLALVRSLTVTGDALTYLPLETMTMIGFLLFTLVLLPIFDTMAAWLRVTVITLLAAAPSLVTLIGGWLFPKRRILSVSLLIIPFVIDMIIAFSLNGTLAGCLDLLVIGLIVLALYWDQK